MSRTEIVSGIIICVSILVGVFVPEIRRSTLGAASVQAPTSSAFKAVRAAAAITGLFAILYIAVHHLPTFSWSNDGSGDSTSGGTADTAYGSTAGTETTVTGAAGSDGTVLDTVSQHTSVSPQIVLIKGVEFVEVPAGESVVGCTSECGSQDLPAKRRKFGSFLMMQHEVTNDEYAACVSAGACKHLGTSFDGTAKPKLPAVNIDPSSAQDFCFWLGGRLPSESDWEYAARSGKDDRSYPWEGKFRPDAAVWNAPQPKEVKSLSPNAWGLYDMAGNVAEWTVSDANEGPPKIIVRGGSFESEADGLRVFHRAVSDAGRWSPATGFRCMHSVQ